jgi:L-malate glycosyltransferase
LRILHLDTGRELRGGQRQLLLLVRSLRERGHDQAIACPDDSPLVPRARQDGLSVVAFSRGQLLPAISTLRQQVSKAGFEILHAHDGRAQTLSALASIGYGAKRIATRRVTFMPAGPSPGIGLHRLQYGPSCDAVIAVSEFIRDLLVRSGIDPAKIAVIRDGIEIPAHLPDAAGRARARAQWNLDPEAFVVGHVGAFTHEKGQDVLLEAFLEFSAHAPRPAQLVLAGDGPERQSPRFIDLLGRTAGRVRMVGWIEDLAPFFAALDLYAMPSRAEGLGSSALLAMAHGLPVAATRAGGLTEVVEDGRSGWLVPSDSPKDLAAALADAAGDHDRLRGFGARARQLSAMFSSDIMVSQTESLYLRLVRGASDPR